MAKRMDYPFEIRPLSAEEGGGFLIPYPDFSDCLPDGKTVEEALTNGKDALNATIAARKAKELSIPAPNSGGVASGKFVARVRKTACALDDAREGRRHVTEYAGPYVHRGRPWTQRAGRISTNKPRQPRVFPHETPARSIAPALGYHQPDDRPPPTPNSSLPGMAASQSRAVF